MLTKDIRDQRDPGLCGLAYLALRERPKKRRVPIADAVQVRVPDYVQTTMSADPAQHHSKTPQTVPQGEPGGD